MMSLSRMDVRTGEDDESEEVVENEEIEESSNTPLYVIFGVAFLALVASGSWLT